MYQVVYTLDGEMDVKEYPETEEGKRSVANIIDEIEHGGGSHSDYRVFKGIQVKVKKRVSFSLEDTQQ